MCIIHNVVIQPLCLLRTQVAEYKIDRAPNRDPFYSILCLITINQRKHNALLPSFIRASHCAC